MVEPGPVRTVLLATTVVAAVLGVAGQLTFGPDAAAGGVVGAIGAGLPALWPAVAIRNGRSPAAAALKAGGVRAALVCGAAVWAFANFGRGALTFVFAVTVAYLVALAAETAALVRALGPPRRGSDGRPTGCGETPSRR